MITTTCVAKEGSKLSMADKAAVVLAESLPKFDPKAAAQNPDGTPGRQSDDETVLLPRMTVEGKRLPIFREQDIHTAKGLKELAVDRYMTETGLVLNCFTIPFLGIGKEAWSLRHWAMDERLRLMREAEEEAALDIHLGDDKRAKEMRKLIRETWGHDPWFLNPGQVAQRDFWGQ